jgi:NAD(P)-dependent dehydrogenase (short-subunit alcohol dehydrogenase family)
VQSNVFVTALNVTDEKSVAAFVGVLSDGRGVGGVVDRIDVLVNNAAITAFDSTKDETMDNATAEQLRNCFDTNVIAVFAVTRALLPMLRRSAHARVLQMSSDFGSIGYANTQSVSISGTVTAAVVIRTDSCPVTGACGSVRVTCGQVESGGCAELSDVESGAEHADRPLRQRL